MSLRSAEFVFEETAVGIRRNPLMTIASISNVTVALCVFGAFLLATVNVAYITSRAQSEARLTVFLKPKLDQQQRLAVEEKVASDARVKSYKYATPEENLRRTLDILGLTSDRPEGAKAFATLAEINPLGGSFDVEPASSDVLKPLAAELRKVPGVDEVRYGQEYIEKLNVLHNLLRAVGTTAIVLLSFATLLVIFSTIRLTVFARRREIRIMQLVGATNWLIRAPFMLEGVVYGVIGAAIACALLVPGYESVAAYVAENLQFIPMVRSAGLIIGFCMLLFSMGIVFGLVGAYVALHRFLRHV